MQCCEFLPEHFIKVNKIISDFIFNGKPSEIPIKQLQLDYQHGGLRYPNVESQYLSMKIKQRIRYGLTRHPINMCIQPLEKVIYGGQDPLKDTVKNLLISMYKKFTISDDPNIDFLCSIVNCPAKTFAKTCSLNAINFLCNRFKLVTVKDVSNEVQFPRSDSYSLLLANAKNNIIKQKLFDLYISEQYSHRTENIHDFWYIKGKTVKTELLTSNKIYWSLIEMNAVGITLNNINLKYKTNFEIDFNPFLNVRKTKNIKS